MWVIYYFKYHWFNKNVAFFYTKTHTGNPKYGMIRIYNVFERTLTNIAFIFKRLLQL